MFYAIHNVMRRAVVLTLSVCAAMTLGVGESAASLIWDWSYSGGGISAAGTFATVDTPDSLGFYLITDITGTRNGETITGLQPTGTAIPGNEPYAVDNLVRLSGVQLTHNGFGYATNGGNYANPFYADFLNPPQYLEFFSAPPFTGGMGARDSELPIRFSARRATIPAPATGALLLIGFGSAGRSWGRRKRL